MIKKVGQWNEVRALISNISSEMKKARDLSLKQFALKAEATAKQHISKQDLGWQPLEPKTVAQKIRRGDSTLILIATSDYFQAITSWVDNGVAYAGVKKQIRNREGDLVADIAKVHEYGTTHIPARPLWQPTYDETLTWFKQSDSTPVKIFAKNIEKYL